ncbi:MAG: hypothetical protein ABI586_08575 [Candidatus Nanopelagicales bacterium]
MLSDSTRRLAALIIPLAGVIIIAPTAAQASLSQPSVVSDNPANVTPNVEDDAAVSNAAVHALGQLGSTMYAGGAFHTVTDAAQTTTYTRSNIMGFDAISGAMTSFSPTFNGTVWAIEPSGSSLFVGGEFTSVNGVARRGLVKVDAATGQIDPTFNPTIKSGNVTEVRLVNGRLIIGGTFPKKLAALDPATGADTGYINISITGKTASNAGPTKIYRFAVNPAGTRLVAIGNFTSVGTATRWQAFMLDLGTTSATLNPWYYTPLQNKCSASGTPAYLRDVDFSPDGSYFVTVATGFVPLSGGVGRDLCDSAARFETNIANPTRPTWINYTGGDTLHSVAVTGVAVYVQGHQRWLDNPFGRDNAGAGAVARAGIGAIDPAAGTALSWNPGKTRDVGGKDLYATTAGLWVGSDGSRFNGEYRHGLAFCPL